MRREQIADPPRQLQRLREPHPLAYSVERRRESRLVHRLHQVVQRVRLERAHRELIVRRHEDDVRHPRRASRPYDLEPVELRHLHVQKDEIRGERLERRQRSRPFRHSPTMSMSS